jgi:hypothetical protein
MEQLYEPTKGSQWLYVSNAIIKKIWLATINKA